MVKNKHCMLKTNLPCNKHLFYKLWSILTYVWGYFGDIIKFVNMFYIFDCELDIVCIEHTPKDIQVLIYNSNKLQSNPYNHWCNSCFLLTYIDSTRKAYCIIVLVICIQCYYRIWHFFHSFLYLKSDYKNNSY